MDGIVIINKEKGCTSHDVVYKVKKLFGKKVGHTGTLDPNATGVLPILIGKGTGLSQFLINHDKKYIATIKLGQKTDTGDVEGNIIEERVVDIDELDGEKISSVLKKMIGKQKQVPPMYSAIKINGKKLYELARQGIETERTPRRVVIHDINIKKIELPYVRFSVSCGKGTYIRSLCRDIGDKLSCGGIMDSLVRSSVNATDTGMSFELSDSLKLDDIEKLVQCGEINEHILSIDKMFPKLIKVKVTVEGDRKLKNGNVLSVHDFECSDDIGFSLPQNTDGSDCLVYDFQGTFTAIYRYHENIHGWKVYKFFV